MKKKILSTVLVFCIVAGFLSATSLPAHADADPIISVYSNNIYANGNAIILTDGTTSYNTCIYLDIDRDGEIDAGVDTIQVIPGLPGTNDTAGYNLGGSNIFGGNGSAALGDTNITMLGGNVFIIFGGGYNVAASVDNTNITIKGGTVLGLIGGGDSGSAVNGSTNVLVTGGSCSEMYGGGNSSPVAGSTNVTINGGTTNNLWAGSMSEDVGSVNITVNGGSINGNLSGGGNGADVLGNSNITINGGTVNGNIDVQDYVNGVKRVKISGGSIRGSVLGTTPMKSDGTTPVYKTTLTLPGIIAETNVSSTITFGGLATGYGLTDVITTDAGVLKFYLPIGDSTAAYSTNGWIYATTVIADNMNTFAHAQSTAPSVTNATVAKSTTTQAAVDFTLNAALTGVWKVYDAETNGALVAGVTASALGTTLTLTHATDIPTGTYYVSLTEAGKTESTRLALTVGAYVAPTYAVSASTNAVAANGVTATATFGCSPYAAGAAATVTITLSGTATASGIHTIGLASAADAGTISPPITVTRTVSAGDNPTDTFAFTFTMPANVVDDLAVTHTFVQASSIMPAATVTTVAKTATTQAAVDFTLNTALTGTWKVYDVTTGGGLIAGITVSASGTALTLAHASDIPAGMYYLSLTEAGKTESTRLALTVSAFDAAAANTASVAAVKGLAEGATYTITQAAATNEAAVKTAIEAKIATLALDGVTPVVTKVSYTPATAGNAGTPAGTNGSYTFTVGLSKGAATAITANLTMNITATAFDAATANTVSVATVKGLAEGAAYTMTQAAATNEAAVKTAIESKIATLALDGVTPVVTKVSYTPATAGNAGTPAGTNGTYTFTVGLSKGAASATTATLTMTVIATAYVDHPIGGGGSGVGGSGGSSMPVTQPISGADILVNGDVVQAGTSVDTKIEGKTITTVTIDEQKLEQKLAAEGDKATVTIPVKTKSDVIIGELNGQMVKNMENRQAVVEVKTDAATYTLPAQQINIDAVSRQLGTAVELKDIKVTIEITKPAQETVKIVENSAKAGEFIIVAPAIEFSISCSYNGKTIDVSKFNAYVERTIAISEGVDTTKITTGVIIDSDGTVRHVPTQIVIIDGKYYAKINSLTNSTYSVIWNPVTFTDMRNHWAKEAVDDMGSRMVISGVGNDMFEPERDITRAEFAAIIVRALGLAPGAGSNNFTDVKSSYWYCDYIKTASDFKVIEGYGNGKFGPNDKMTLEQAITMIVRAMKITGLKVSLTEAETQKLLLGFGMKGKPAADWAKDNIAMCIKAGIVSKTNGKMVYVKENITRAEVAVIVRNLLQKSKLI